MRYPACWGGNLSMFDRYTEGARRALFLARFEASLSGSRQIEIEHLLLGIFREVPELMHRLLRSAAGLDAMRHQIAKHYPATPGVQASADLPLSADTRRAAAYGAEEAGRLRHSDISTEHLLAGIFRVESSIAAGFLRQHGVTIDKLRSEAMRQPVREAPPGSATALEPHPAAGPVRDLTEAARLGKLGPLIGRDRELDRIVHILSRRTKNNAVLIGEAGIGKAAIVEGLAHRMADGEVPPALADRRLLALDASSLTARQRSRLAGTPEDLLATLPGPGEPILFVRGLFNLAVAASAWPVVEAMHALEPLLAHTGVQCIATGSPAGLRETVAKAGMLARHFEVAKVAPVSEGEAIRIVEALKAQFEQFHGVVFDEGAIEAAVRASRPFLPGRHLPDRAIDLIDEAAAAVKLRRRSGPREQHELKVTPEDIVAAVAARAGVTAEAATRVLQEQPQNELQRIAAELAAQVPMEDRDWIPFLAAYLLRCPPTRAESLAQAIVAASAKPPEPRSGQD